MKKAACTLLFKVQAAFFLINQALFFGTRIKLNHLFWCARQLLG